MKLRQLTSVLRFFFLMYSPLLSRGYYYDFCNYIFQVFLCSPPCAVEAIIWSFTIFFSYVLPPVKSRLLLRFLQLHILGFSVQSPLYCQGYYYQFYDLFPYVSSPLKSRLLFCFFTAAAAVIFFSVLGLTCLG